MKKARTKESDGTSRGHAGGHPGAVLGRHMKELDGHKHQYEGGKRRAMGVRAKIAPIIN